MERLFDHQQAEVVERSEDVEVLEGVRGVRVDRQEDVRMVGPDRRDAVEVHPGRDLELDPPVAVGEVPVHLGTQLIGGLGDADRHAAEDGLPGRSQVRGERLAASSQLGVQHRVHEGRLRHRVAPDEAEDIVQRLRRYLRLVEQGGREERLDRTPGALVPLRTEVGLDVGDAFTPSLGVVGLDPDQDAFLARRDPERGSERPHERQPDQPELDATDRGHRAASSFAKR